MVNPRSKLDVCCRGWMCRASNTHLRFLPLQLFWLPPSPPGVVWSRSELQCHSQCHTIPSYTRFKCEITVHKVHTQVRYYSIYCMVFLNNAFSYTAYRHTPTMLSICLVIAVIFYDYTDSGKCGRMLRGYDRPGIQRPKTAPSIYEYGTVFPEYRAKTGSIVNQMRTIPVLRTYHAWPYTQRTRNADETVFHTYYSSFFAVCNRVRSVVAGAPVPFPAPFRIR